MSKTVILVKPPERSSFSFGTFSLGVLAAAVRDLAEVSILDATALPAGQAAATVASRRPELVGATVMSLESVAPAGDWIRRLRAQLGRSTDGARSTRIVAGGHGASMLPTSLLEAGADAVVIGEGEVTFRQIVQQGIRPGAAGIACLAQDRVLLGPRQALIRPLDRLRPPARDLMPPSPNGVHLMETSRGCPHRCAFCEATRFHQLRWRYFSAERVVAEIRRLVEEYDAWVIHFADDNFAASRRRVLQICKALEREPLPACFVVSARGDDLASDARLLPAMAAAGMLRVSVGVETLNTNVAAGVGKPIGLATYADVFRRMRELGIFSVASLIVGLPGEDNAARERSVEFAVAAGPDAAQFVPFLPLPGTPLGPGPRGSEPEPADARDAQRFTRAFYHHPTVQARLRAAAQADGVRALLARATLELRTGGTPEIAALSEYQQAAVH